MATTRSALQVGSLGRTVLDSQPLAGTAFGGRSLGQDRSVSKVGSSVPFGEGSADARGLAETPKLLILMVPEAGIEPA